MTRLLVAGKLHPAGEAMIDSLRRAGHHVDYVPDQDERAFVPYLPEADALAIRTQPLDAGMIASAGRLRIVSRHGVGYDAVDVEALNERHIALTVVGDVNSVSVAEHAMMQLLAGAKRVVAADHAVRESGQWGWRNALEARELCGKTLLVIGFGRIGQRLARMAGAFDMRVIGYDPYLPVGRWPEDLATPVTSLQQALGEADFISVHIPPGSSPLLGPEEIDAMKPGVVLSNTARGGVIDEAALAGALSRGDVAFAGIDVFGTEPPRDGHPLVGSDNTLLSPHIGGLTDEAAERMAIACLRNAIDYLDGSINPDLIVNREAIHA